ncbi:alpha/beta fold hydrolase [Amycolatopsis sp. cg5]|uniref:alpha/beta fold hydrolase n=1 Tax=Amycolatopsis sp. cg5 TaxID=3238802 RepID=UPI0035267236
MTRNITVPYSPVSRMAGNGGGLARLAAALRVPLWHEAQAFRQRLAIERHPLWRTPPLDMAGLPVLLVGGMGSTPMLLSSLQQLLQRLNCRVRVAPVRFGIGCGEATAQAVEDSLTGLVEYTSAPAVVIAHSRGGQFARAVAARRPELLRGLITLGSPLTRMLAVHPLLWVHVTALGAAGAIGVPGLLRPGCLWGTCCAPLRADLTGPFPDAVPFLSIYSRRDRIVDWRSCLDPAARHHEIVTSHGGLIWDPVSLTAIVEELGTLGSTTRITTGDSPKRSDLAA